jgi:hypothetical protein
MYANALTTLMSDMQDQEWLNCGLHPLSLRFAAFKVPIIIARTLWAFPSILSHFLLNMYLVAVLMTITMVLIYKGILKVNTKLRVSQRFKQATMTLYVDQITYQSWQSLLQ